jgi:acyl transferase domain-containing protein/ubiquinone/menaquinone biosynthesis C-methylase UbiE/acyl carrier protein
MNFSTNDIKESDLAIIAMSGRFPGAKNIDAFWENLRFGVESIARFSGEELLMNGVLPELLQNPNYVRASAWVDDIELFDANFFGFNPKEAEILDPQQRLFLECAWETLEQAGYNPQTYAGTIGVYAGVGASNYLLKNLYLNPAVSKTVSTYQLRLATEKDFLPTRVAYKLNLTGPALNIQTACSTSLVAVHVACQSLINGECDMTLAGGVSISIPQKEGYLYQEGMILSPDGHCRAFDAKAQGTIAGDGVGIVMLKRATDALADGDYIHAIIKGSAINNDGTNKIGFTAPSVEGQAAVIGEAQAIAGIDAETISYIEAHGTGTELGDPIEIAALTKAFHNSTKKKHFCAIGSVKTNIGHLNTAAGVAGLIKTVLALKHQQIPPSLHFETPNPKIDFANSPFYVNTKLSEWKTNGTPRRAGVSSFGIGGTNAHVVLEEAPVLEKKIGDKGEQTRPVQLLVLSAKTSKALETATLNLNEHLKQHPELNLADVAYTLSVGRQAFEHRRILVCSELDEAITTLPEQVLTGYTKSSTPSVVFMFSGQGSQYVNMAREIYQTEAIFREQIDRCAELLRPELGLDLRDILYPSPSRTEEATKQLQQTAITQPALFTIEYALAKLWESWGIQPQGFIGHSIGEYVAACLAGVFSLEDALCLVAARGRMMQQLPPGAMLSVPLAPEALEALLGGELSIAAINEPSRCVVSGPMEAVANLLHQLGEQGIECIRLRTSHAFHSQMMEPILEPFAKLVQKVTLRSPQIPYISNVTGTWITADQAIDPHYWSQHLRSPVQFARGIEHCLKTPDSILLEVGPGRTLSTLTKHHPSKEANQLVLTSLRHPQEVRSDMAFLLTTLGQLWLGGVNVNWSGFYANEQRYRVPLPTYPFERQRYWVESQKTNNREHLQQNLTAPPIWNTLVEAGRIQASSEISKLTNSTEQAKKECLDRLSIAYMLEALRGIGAFSNPEESYSVEEFFDRFQIQSRYHQLVSQWLSILVERGYLQQDGNQFIKLVRLTEDISTLVEEAKVKWVSQPEQLNLLMRCGKNLVSVLTGKEEPLDLFFSEGSFNVYENIIEESVSIPYYNGIWQACLQQVVNSLPPQRQLRILEVGAGSGITTSVLLPILPPSPTSYTFTDVGSAFLRRAKQKFSAYPFVEYRLLNIEQPPQAQGYELHKFDVVVATNVLHVTRNMGETLKHVRSLLAPGGILLIQEITEAKLSFYLTYGLLMQSLSDGQRNQANPFLSTQQWHEALSEQGFAEVAIFPEIHDLTEHILVARVTPSGLFPSAFTELVESKAAIAPLYEVSLSKKPDIADWFYIPSWKRNLLPTPMRQVKSSWLFFVDSCGLGNQLVEKLKQAGEDVTVVRVGEQFTKYDASLYTVNPRQSDDYDTLLKELSTSDKIPTYIVHLWSVTENSSIESRLEWVELTQDLGYCSLIFLVQALGKQNSTDELKLTVVSNGMQEVIGEELLYPEKATMLGLIRTIPQEYPDITPLSIDVVLPQPGSESEQKLITHLLNELQTTSSERIIAYRGNHRWVQTFEPVRLDKSEQGLQRLREEGVYLITGGLGGIGLILAEHLAHTVRAKLILTGRSAFPDRSEWEKWLNSHDDRDRVSQKIRKLQKLEKLGAEVLVVSVDVANLSQMQGAIAKATDSFGKINGVIHAAGVPAGGVIQRKTLEMIEGAFAPKVKGTLVLDSIFKDMQLDWFVLCSSLSSFVGNFGLVDYCATNAFLDSFAHYQNNRDGTFTVSINWDIWPEVGMAVEAAKRFLASDTKFSPTQLTEETARTALPTFSFSDSSFGTTTPTPLVQPHLKYGLLPTEGVEVFHRILCHSIPQVLVSTRDLEIAIKPAKEETRLKQRQDLAEAVDSQSRSPRPALTNAYVAPRNELEQTIAQIWQDFLGIELIGIYDNFFELGGDSLLGIQLTSKLSVTLQKKISINSFLNALTIAALAEFIDEEFFIL